MTDIHVERIRDGWRVNLEDGRMVEAEKPHATRGAVCAIVTARNGSAIYYRDTVNLTSARMRSHFLHVLDERKVSIPEQVLLALEEACRTRPLRPPGDTVNRDAGNESAAEEALPHSNYINARALVRQHGQHLRYCYPWKSWLVWTGTHWKRDTSGRVMSAAKGTIKKLACEVEALDDSTAAKVLLVHIQTSLATAKLKAMVESAQSEPDIPIQPEALDADPWLLNCTNGTLDLHTGTLQPHRPDDLLTKCLSIHFDAHAPCPTWKRFLWRIMGGTTLEEDTEEMSTSELEQRQAADDRAQRLVAFLQRAIGYSLTGDTREQCLFVLHGSGANGKSTFLEVLQALLGDYAQSTPSASLLAKSRPDGIPNDIGRLRGARLVTAVEIGEGKRLNEELVKRLTGQDTLTARFLHAEFFDFRAEFKIFIACNHLPTIKGTDHAIWRRIRLIPFEVTIPDTEQDKNLATKLRAELPGILRWAVEGCLNWQQEGLGPPAEVQEATANYRASMDNLGEFLEDMCLIGDAYRTKPSTLYTAYQHWCSENTKDPLAANEFGTRLTERGFPGKKGSHGVRWRLGIALRDPDNGTGL